MPFELTILLFMMAVAFTSYFIKYFINREKKSASAKRLQNADLIKVILNLEPEKLDELFELYRREFGAGAARYARRTYNKWKSGEVRPNRQTFNRLLMRLPSVMSFDLKCELLRTLRQEYCARSDYRLTVDTANWKESVAPLVAEVVRKSQAAELPKQVEERLRWLSNDDMRIAGAILSESHALESRNAMLMLEREFDNIEELLSATGGRGEVTHVIKLPLGTIRLKVEGKKRDDG